LKVVDNHHSAYKHADDVLTFALHKLHSTREVARRHNM